MDFLIPLSFFRVRYETAAGRPYSELDKCVLESISAGATSLTGLQSIFMLRSRLLIEAIVTLARAGWIAIDVSNGGFRITPSGRDALQLDKMPLFTIIGTSETKLVMEGLTGSLVGQQEMKPYLSNRLIEQNNLTEVQKLGREFNQMRLDPGQVTDHLELEQGEWLRWVDVPELISREYHWLLVNVDLAGGVVHNVPDRWRRNLEPILLDRARKRTPGKAVKATTLEDLVYDDQRTEVRTYPEVFSENDVLLSRREHFDILVNALTNAKSTIFVASAFFDTSEVDDQIRKLILSALKRGVQIYLLWGFSVRHGALSTDAGLNWLREMKKEAGEHGRRLRFNLEPTDSHAKLLIFDQGEEFQAFVGSCNWLSACLALKGDSREPTEVTVRLRHPALIASLCRSAAGFWKMSKRGVLADAPELLRRAAERLDFRAENMNVEAVSADSCHQAAKVRIIRDQEHETKMRELLLSGKERCLIVSNKLGAKAAIRLAPLNAAGQKRFKQLRIQYSKATSGAPSLTEIVANLKPLDGQLSRIASRHSKLVVVDNIALISSYNFLSADPFGTFSSAKEVGVLIDGGPLPEMLWKAHI